MSSDGSPDDLTGPVNLGNPEEITIRELAEKILELTGSPSKILYQPLPWDDPQRRRPDIGLATIRLGWIPQVPIEEGLMKTINYLDSLMREGIPIGGAL